MKIKLSNVLLVASASLLICSAVLLPACGGCPWIHHSDVSVSPQASCLELSIADQSGDAPSTGCVNPVLMGKNACAQPLVLPADYTTDGTELVVAPNESFTYEVHLSSCMAVGDNYHASIPATLGSDSVLIEFDLYAP